MDTQDLVTYSVAGASLVVGVAALAVRRRRTSWGLGLRGGGPQVLRGAGLGLLGVAVLWAAFVVSGLGDPGPSGGVTGAGASLGVAAGFAVLFVVEEAVFRGIGTGGLAAFVGIWPATIVLNVAVATAYAANGEAGPMAVASQVLSNLVLGVARVRTGRIWLGLGLKIVWNGGMVALGWPDAGVTADPPLLALRLDGPDWLTGGGFGAEAGLVGIAVLALLVLAVSRAPRPVPRQG